MSDLDDEFKAFLKAYGLFPDLTDSNREALLSEEERNKLISNAHSQCDERFAVWKRIPLEIRERYQGKVPDWIMEIAAEGDTERMRLVEQNRDIVNKAELEKKQAEDIDKSRKEYAEMRDSMFKASEVAVAAVVGTIIATGYTEMAANALATERLFRDSLADKAIEGTMSDKEKDMWRRSREETRHIIRDEWANFQPEKYLVHLLSQYNRSKIDEGRLGEKIKETVEKIRDLHRMNHLNEYLNRPQIQAKLHRFSEEKTDNLLKSSKQMNDLLKVIDTVLFIGEQAGVQISKKRAEFLEKLELPADVQTVLQKIKDGRDNARNNDDKQKTNKVARVRIRSNQNTAS